MNDDFRDWQWVDEDPLEKKLLVEKALRDLPDLRIAAPPTPPEADLDPLAVLASVTEAPARRTPVQAAIDLEKLERWEAAADAYRVVLETEPDNAEARIRLGGCLLHLERAQEALYCFELCLSFGFRPERSMLGKAVALQKMGRLAEADKHYHKLLQMAPEEPEVLANLIALSVERHDAPAVADYSLRLLQVDPDSKAALRGLAAYAAWNHKPDAPAETSSPVAEVEEVTARNGVAHAPSEQLLDSGISSSLASVKRQLAALFAPKPQAPGSARHSWSGFYHRTAKESGERAS